MADFCVSKLLSETGQMETFVGTPYYIAPEVVTVAQRPFEWYTTKADCWSLGVLLYQLLTGERPFRSRPDRYLALLWAVSWTMGHPHRFSYLNYLAGALCWRRSRRGSSPAWRGGSVGRPATSSPASYR